MNQLIEWSKSEFGDLPWRKDRSLYSTLVSEIMLQQTTVSTVLNHYNRFLDEYPEVQDVARASDESLTASWKGLGYYRRARNLKKACEYFCDHFDGNIPLDFDTLVSVPGIGEYTANAILAIGANQRALALDANLERVISRLYGIDALKGPMLLKKLYQLFYDKKICAGMKSGKARDYNEALMDLGRTYCKANKASCELCPLSETCVAFKEKRPLYYPVKNDKKTKKLFQLNLLRAIVHKDDKVLVYKKTQSEWLSGQWEVPTFVLSSEDSSITQYPFIKFPFSENLPEYKTGITKYKIINKTVLLSVKEFESLGQKVSDYVFKDPAKCHLSTGSEKALKLLL